MKKILLLALIAGFAISANAQWRADNGRDRDYRYGNDRYDRQESYNRIAHINDQFNDRINAVRYNPYLRNRDKRRQIRDLERERRSAIENCQGGYTGRYPDMHDRDQHDRW